MISVSSNNNKQESFGDDHVLLISRMFPAGVLCEQMETASQQVSPAEDKKSRKKRIRKRKSKPSSSVDGRGDAGFKKRKLNEEQVRHLELNFGNEHKLETERKDRLASELGLDPRQVAVWFQNRRARWKIKKQEEEYSKLKAAHDSLVLRKCQLESQVTKLEEQLAGKEREVKRLRLSLLEGNSSNSPISCLSMEQAIEDVAPLFSGAHEIMDEGLLTNLFYYNMPDQSGHFVPGLMECSNLYHM